MWRNIIRSTKSQKSFDFFFNRLIEFTSAMLSHKYSIQDDLVVNKGFDPLFSVALCFDCLNLLHLFQVRFQFY
jgi:hypothetical protein